MLTGLEILLDRMKTNPEEFLKDNHVPYEGESFGGKWNDLINYAWRVADADERKMLEDAQRQFYRDDFNERVFKRLAGEEVRQEQPSPYIVKGNTVNAVLAGGGGSGGTWTDPRAALQNSILQGGQYDPNRHGLITANGFQAAETKQEGATIGVDPSFWGGITGRFWR